MHRQLHLRVTPLEQRQPKAQPRRGELVDLAAGEHEGEARAAHLGEHLLPAAQPAVRPAADRVCPIRQSVSSTQLGYGRPGLANSAMPFGHKKSAFYNPGF